MAAILGGDDVSNPELERSNTLANTRKLRMSRMLNTGLLEAIEDQNNSQVEKLLQDGANPNATCRMTSISAVHLAAMSNATALRMLLDVGALRHRVDNFGRTPIVLAAWTGAARQIAMLLDFPEDLQLKVMLGMTLATELEVKALPQSDGRVDNTPAEEDNENQLPEGWKDGIEHKCIGYKANLPAFERDLSPLQVASFAAHHHCVRLLLAAGADPTRQDSSHRTAMDLAGFAIYHDIDVKDEDFIKTIKTLLEFGGTLNTDTMLVNFISVLHTAVKVGSVTALPLLLDAGACVHHLNHEGYTPLHECVRAKTKEPLQILASYSSPNQSCATIDIRDKFGYTVLQMAVAAAWVPGVCVALEAGANVILTNYYGDTAIHLAATVGDLEVLKEILGAALLKRAINKENNRGETAIVRAILEGREDCVRYLLAEGASLRVTCMDKILDPECESGYKTISKYKKGKDILHVATAAGHIHILSFLMDYDRKLSELLYHEVPSLENKTPLEYAVEKNNIDIFRFLLDKTFKSYYSDYETFKSGKLYKYMFRLIDIVATLNRTEIFGYILDFDRNHVESNLQTNSFVNDAIREGFSLHKAIINRSREMVIILLQNGANLAQKNEKYPTALNLIMCHIFKPTEFLENIFDMYIYSNNKNIYDRECEIFIDYSVLMPNEIDGDDNKSKGLEEVEASKQQKKRVKLEQMKVLEALLETGNRKGQRELLAHPLVESFLYLKWETLSIFIYLIILIYSLFLMSLNTYIVSIYYYKDSNTTRIGEIPVYYEPDIWKYIVYVTAGLIAIQEVFFLNMKKLRSLLEIDTWVKIGTVVLALVLPTLVTKESSEEQWKRNMSTTSVILSWMNMLFLLSWTPTWGYYMQMFGKVSLKVIKIILCFSFMVICFAISFMIQFHTLSPFDGPLAAFFKTTVMMTSEFDYGTLVETTQELSSSILMLRLVFLCFLVFVSIVLMNLMIGVAVNDLQSLTHKGNLRRLEKQTACLCMIESFVNIGIVDRFLRSYKLRVKKTAKIRPIDNDWYHYTGNIREVITNKAQSQHELLENKAEGIRTKTNMEKVFKIASTKSRDADADNAIDDVPVSDENKYLIDRAVKSAVAELKKEIESKLNKTNMQISATNQILTALLEKMNL